MRKRAPADVDEDFVEGFSLAFVNGDGPGERDWILGVGTYDGFVEAAAFAVLVFKNFPLVLFYFYALAVFEINVQCGMF